MCPTTAITFSGELPPAEDLTQLDEVPGWELEWSRWRGVEEDTTERDRRYGRDYEVAKEDGYVHVKMRFPTRVPAVRDRFRYGLQEDMPLYRSHVQLNGTELLVAGWLTDPKIKALTHTSSSLAKLAAEGGRFSGSTESARLHRSFKIGSRSGTSSTATWHQIRFNYYLTITGTFKIC